MRAQVRSTLSDQFAGVSLRWARSRVARRTVRLIILGLNTFHGDSSAALVQDGKLVAATVEKRFRLVK